MPDPYRSDWLQDRDLSGQHNMHDAHEAPSGRAILILFAVVIGILLLIALFASPPGDGDAGAASTGSISSTEPAGTPAQ